MERLPPRETRQGWHDRGYLPHFDGVGYDQAVTIRLADSLPRHVVKSLAQELEALPENERTGEEIRRLNRFLDAGHGSCILKEKLAAALVQEALFFGHQLRYDLLAWVIMPNHVHAIVQPFEGWPLGKIVATWKKRSAREINKAVGRRGSLWYREYFDRFQRDYDHFQRTTAYIEANPVKAGLRNEASEWRWSSARFRNREGAIDWALIAATFGLPGGHSGEWRSLETSPL